MAAYPVPKYDPEQLTAIVRSPIQEAEARRGRLALLLQDTKFTDALIETMCNKFFILDSEILQYSSPGEYLPKEYTVSDYNHFCSAVIEYALDNYALDDMGEVRVSVGEGGDLVVGISFFREGVFYTDYTGYSGDAAFSIDQLRNGEVLPGAVGRGERDSRFGEYITDLLEADPTSKAFFSL